MTIIADRVSVKAILLADAAETAPPRAPLCVTLGITGHRSANGALLASAQRIEQLVVDIRKAALALAEREAAFFAETPPCFRLVSPLAEGADQLAAEIALRHGYVLQAVVPFARGQYEGDFGDPDARRHFHDLAAAADCILELPGQRGAESDAYAMAGRATVAHCDILIAVWDGLPARGRGGTGEVVECALRRGAPVIHVPIDAAAPLRIIWNGLDPMAGQPGLDAAPERICDRAALDLVMAELFAPPTDPVERAFILAFYCERERRLKPRIEYPLLLALTGARDLARSAWRAAPYADATAAEWSAFRTVCTEKSHGVVPDLGRLENAYCWSDRLAQHFAQTYRSGHVLNFAFAGLSVVLALTVLIAPGLKILLSVTELILIVAIIANTRIGTAGAWHRRWLDYRQLAERLRPMRSHKLLGLAQPGFAADAARGGKRRWVDWYAASVWRVAGCPRGRIAAAGVQPLAALVNAEELQPQIAYHRDSARHMQHLDHRLHIIGTALFVLTVLSGLIWLVGYAAGQGWATVYMNAFIFVSGALPAIGTAVFGIRVQGDFGGTAERSLATALRLEAIAARLDEPGLSLARAADLAEAAARTMLADLGEWRLLHSQHKLVIPA